MNKNQKKLSKPPSLWYNNREHKENVILHIKQKFKVGDRVSVSYDNEARDYGYTVEDCYWSNHYSEWEYQLCRQEIGATWRRYVGESDLSIAGNGLQRLAHIARSKI